MAISRKFEIYVDKPTLSTSDEIQRFLTPFIRNCFPRDSVPRDIDDRFILGKDREKETISKRVVYGIREMYAPPSDGSLTGRFGVEFAWQVVEADGCVRRLVWRIGEAKKALRPFEGSGSGDTM
jgi:phosphatidylethanolamine N-methyltransferase